MNRTAAVIGLSWTLAHSGCTNGSELGDTTEGTSSSSSSEDGSSTEFGDATQDTGGSAGVDPQSSIRQLLRIPVHLQTPYIPDFNPISAEKIELGRYLFYDRRLSANETQSCADCHFQEMGFADGLRTPTGSTGTVLARNSMGLANIAYNLTYTWAHNGLLELEDQVQIPLRADNPVELGITDAYEAEVLERFATDPTYSSMFDAAFPDSESGPTVNKIAFALASFLRRLISGNSPYDRFVAGDRDALTPEQRRGMSLFMGERLECFHCHNGIFQTVSYRDEDTDVESVTFPFFNNGLYNVDGDGSYPVHDQGLFELTFDPDHRGLFRPPSLRNIAVTGPYMHDGSLETLDDVLDHYAAGGSNRIDGPFAGDGRLSPLKSGLVRGFTLTQEERADVIAFLEALTDQEFLTDPALSNPLPP